MVDDAAKATHGMLQSRTEQSRAELPGWDPARTAAELPGAAEEDSAEWVHLYVNHIHFSWLPG